MKKKLRSRGYWVLLTGAAALFAGMLFICPDGVQEGVSNGLNLCATVIIPSMFPFMALSSFLVKSGIATRIGRVLEKPTRLFFGLPGCAATAIFVSMIGGYPVGAKAVSELHKSGEITDAQCSRMYCFCVNAGPAFLISAVGSGMLGSAQAGLLIYLSQIAVSMIIGIASRFFIPDHSPAGKEPRRSQTMQKRSAIDAFVGAIADTGQSMLVICGFVALFSAILGGFSRAGVTGAFSMRLADLFYALHLPVELAHAVLPSILEVTSGAAAAAGATEAAVVFISAACGWSGLSVQFQILSVGLKDNVSKSNFWMSRAIAAALSALVTALLLRCFPIELETLAVSAGTAPLHLSSSVPAAVALLLFSAFMLLVSPENALEFDQLHDIMKKKEAKKKRL